MSARLIVLGKTGLAIDVLAYGKQYEELEALGLVLLKQEEYQHANLALLGVLKEGVRLSRTAEREILAATAQLDQELLRLGRVKSASEKSKAFRLIGDGTSSDRTPLTPEEKSRQIASVRTSQLILRNLLQLNRQP